MGETNPKECSRCLYNSTIPEISFDKSGVCIYCKMHDAMDKRYPLNNDGEKNFENLIKKIKSKGKNKKYDCIVGLSGGRDSTYTLLQAKKLGLRVLAVHFDNGWNSDISNKNITNALSNLKFDLETYVVDWNEFKDLQVSFLKASVSDAEGPTDLLVHAVLHRIAAKENIKYILLGHSFRTEGIVPKSWTYFDYAYLKSVHKKFGTIKLKKVPRFNLFDIFYYLILKRIRVIPFLNYYDYSKEAAGKVLENELKWIDYKDHHFENTYAMFCHYFYMPKKFNINKRILTLSALIRDKKISKSKAKTIMSDGSHVVNKEIIDFTLKKLDLNVSDLEMFMKLKPKSYEDFNNYLRYLKPFRFLVLLGLKLKIVPEIVFFKYFAEQKDFMK